MKINEPLSSRMRPSKLSEIIGQEHLTGENKPLSKIVKSSGRVPSFILYGPPGVGKTSIATALSKELNKNCFYFNASIHSKKELEKITNSSSPMLPNVIIVDEVHRLTKPNQDFLLMKIEEGSIILIGATTDNPYMSLTPALRSRTFTFELKKLSKESLIEVLERALKDEKRGLGSLRLDADSTSLEMIASHSNGDVRYALNVLESAASAVSDGVLKKEDVEEFIQWNHSEGDKDGDNHYNLLSAFQKSIRGSDVDASLHYLARLIKIGDIASINRRLTVIAYEDIGLANPDAVNETLNAVNSAERVGFPEARIIYSYIVTRLAMSPKSNVTYKAIKNALSDLEKGKDTTIPSSLHDTHYHGASKLKKGLGYKYSHDYPYGIAPQQFMPEEFVKSRYLEFRDKNDLPKVKETYERLNQILKK